MDHVTFGMTVLICGMGGTILTLWIMSLVMGLLGKKGFVIYPGKVSKASAFRIGHIGDVYPADMERLVKTIETSMFWKE